MTRARRLRSAPFRTRLAAAVLATVAAGLVGAGTTPPAEAATCSSASGVSVVVDFGSMGGVQTACVDDGAGKSAAALFGAAGFSLTYVQSDPGFVCRVDDLPGAEAEPCVKTPPATAYWGLWWSDGTSGSWSYSNYGVDALSVPAGAYVGFAWKSGTGQASPPGVSPAAHPAATPTQASSGASSSPTKTPRPTAKPTTGPTTRPTTRPTTSPTRASSATPTPTAISSATPTATGTPSSSVSASASGPGASATPSGSAGPTTTPSSSAGPGSAVAAPQDGLASEPADAGGSALPAWVVPVVLLALAGAGGAAVVVRRRRSPG